MPDKKITELTSANLPLGGGEELAIVQSGVTKRTSVNDLSSGFNASLNLKEDKANKGVADGYAPLNGSVKIDSIYLPSFVDDVIEVADFAYLPLIGETGKIYLTLDNNKIYRWGGSVYIDISQGVSSHSQLTLDDGTNPHGVTKGDVGLGNVVNADTTTTVNITDSLNKRFVTDADLTDLSNLSGVNTGDETLTTLQTKRPIKTIEGQSLEGVGNIDLVKSDVGLSNVDNTADLNKPISTATQTALNLKEDSDNKRITMTGNTSSNVFFLTAKAIYDWAVSLFQPLLVSGTNIKTINSQSLLGSGNLVVATNPTLQEVTANGNTTTNEIIINGIIAKVVPATETIGLTDVAILGNNNLGIGFQTLINNTSGSLNVAIGNASQTPNVSGNSNISIGYLSLGGLINGVRNVALGVQALSVVNGSDNVGIGENALSNITTGGGNIGIGTGVTVVNGQNNQINIGNFLRKDSSGNFGIDISTPTAKLDINGSTRLRGTLLDFNNETGSSGQILSSTGAGVDWIDAPIGMTTITATIGIDFGVETNTIIANILEPTITISNIKGISFIPIETAETSLDDFQLNGVSFNIENIIDGVSFDIRAKATNKATGIYTIKYIIQI